jgi:crotonobetainyl-CoA:carnitine CoA-transferase CaiB-like acyl-CoA transferase
MGAYCTKLLADLGADVIKVEPPAGDPMRRRPPLLGAESGPPESAVFASYHANKRGVTLDICRPESLPILAALGSASDVVVISPTSRRPVTGFDREACNLEWAPPSALVACITPFGLDGPMADMRVTPFLSFAIGGGMHWVGKQDGPPLAAPGQIAWDEAGIHAALGVVAALLDSGHSEGQLLDLSVHEVQAAKDFILERFDQSRPDEWSGRFTGVGIPPTGTFECADGPFGIAAHQQHHWQCFLQMLDQPDELTEPSLCDPMVRRAIFDGLQETIAGLVSGRSRLDLFARGQASGLPCAPVNSPPDFIQDEQPLFRQVFGSPSRDGRPSPTIPWRWCHATPELISLDSPAPSLGEHNAEVYVDELGFTKADLEEWAEAGVV